MRVRYSFGSRHTGHIKNILKQRAKFPNVAKEVIDISDIILEVLDARFVEETRNLFLEEKIKEMGKKIIFILNKADLVDTKKVEKELSKELTPRVFVSAKTKQGARLLRERIKIEAKRVDLSGERERVQVGIVGYPNTGKSSLINLITRRGAARTSKQAGFTKGIQKIRMADDILILDTPGVIPDERYSSIDEESISTDAILGARTFSDVRNPEEVIYALMKRASAKIEKFYGVVAKEDPEILLEKVGKNKNFLLKGGKADVDRTARQIIRDWQEGKIR